MTDQTLCLGKGFIVLLLSEAGVGMGVSGCGGGTGMVFYDV